MKELIARMEKGRDLLDQRTPDWRTKVNLSTFNIATLQCILGQVYGNYMKGLDELNIAYGYGHGFYANSANEAMAMNTWWKEQVKAVPQ